MVESWETTSMGRRWPAGGRGQGPRGGLGEAAEGAWEEEEATGVAVSGAAGLAPESAFGVDVTVGAVAAVAFAVEASHCFTP